MKFLMGVAAAVLAAGSADATVVASSLPYQGTPDWSDVVFSGTSMIVSGGEAVLTTANTRGVWFGWLSGSNTPGWSIADNNLGNYLSLQAKFSAGADDWSAYMGDGTRYAAMQFNPTGCNSNLQNCYLFAGTPGVTLSFAGDTPGSSREQFVALDTTVYNSFEWLLLGDTVTYRINGRSYSDTAITNGGKLLIIGDGSGSSPTGTGSMSIAGVSFDTAPDFAELPGMVPEPSAWAMLITGFGLIGAARRRQRRLVA